MVNMMATYLDLYGRGKCGKIILDEAIVGAWSIRMDTVEVSLLLGGRISGPLFAAVCWICGLLRVIARSIVTLLSLLKDI